MSLPSIEIASASPATIYEQIVQPKQAVELPGYLRWHLYRLPPASAWLYVAAALLGPGETAPAKLAALCGLSPDELLDLLQDPQAMSPLDGLLQVAVSPERLHLRITSPPPLLPPDAGHLKTWLRSRQVYYPTPQDVLAAACQAPLPHLIPSYWDLEVEDLERYAGQPLQTVRQAVLALYGDLLSEIDREVLIARLQAHLFPPENTLRVSRFFLTDVLPHLGPAPAWLLTLLRDPGEWRELEQPHRFTALRPESRREARMASWLLGVSPRHIADWLQPGMPLSLYLRQRDPEEGGEAFDVRHQEIPAWLLALALDRTVWPRCRERFQRAAAGETLPGTAWRDCKRYLAADPLPLQMPLRPEMARLLLSLGERIAAQAPQWSADRGEVPADWGQPGPRHLSDRWNWAVLFACNPEIAAEDRAWLLENEVPPQAFVAWMLFAWEGEESAADALEFTLRQLRQGKWDGPGTLFEPFLRLEPPVLLELLGNPERQAMHWAEVFGENPDRWAALIPRLFGDEKIVR